MSPEEENKIIDEAYQALINTISTATVTWAVLIAFYYNQIDHLSTTPQVSSCRSQSLYRDSRHPRVDP